MERMFIKEDVRRSANRKTPFVIGEYYHVFNRGVDKRTIFEDMLDLERFFQSMTEFNTSSPIGSIYENKFGRVSLGSSTPKLEDEADGGSDMPLVSFVSYCLNPNHYHFELTPLQDKGIERFMQRLGTGYTNYFNERHKRSGALFQGRYKGIGVLSDEQLRHLSIYINLNNRPLGSSTPKLELSRSSWEEYVGETDEEFCDGKSIVLNQFKGAADYRREAFEGYKLIKARKEAERELSKLLGS